MHSGGCFPGEGDSPFFCARYARYACMSGHLPGKQPVLQTFNTFSFRRNFGVYYNEKQKQTEKKKGKSVEILPFRL